MMTERDRPASKIPWNWDRVLLALALVVAIGVGLDQHWADDKIIGALNQRLQSTQDALDASQAENAAVASVSFDTFLKQYNVHVGALNTAVAAYDRAAKIAATRFVGSVSTHDAAEALAKARTELYAAADNFTHFVTLWRAVAEPFNKMLDGNAAQLENSRREDNAADVSAAVHRIVTAAPDLATPLRVALDQLKRAPPP